MTWFGGLPEGVRDWDRLSALHPEAFVALQDVVAAAWTDTDPVLFELARLRIATLLDNTAEAAPRNVAGLSAAQVSELAAWPTSENFTPRDRACLALTEQFVMDANRVTDEQVAGVTEHLGPAGCYAFVEAVSVLETFQRVCLTLGIRTAPGIDDILRQAVKDRASPEVSA